MFTSAGLFIIVIGLFTAGLIIEYRYKKYYAKNYKLLISNKISMRPASVSAYVVGIITAFMAVTAGIAFTDAVNTNNNRQVIIKALRDNSVSIEQYHNRLSSHLSDVPKHLAENTIDYPAGIKALIEKTEILFIIRQDTFISISSALRNIEFYIDRINIVPDDEKEAAFRRILANYRTLTRLLNDEIAYIDQNNRPWNRWLQP